MLIIDTHCDTLFMRALAPNDTPCVTLENLRKGGVNLQTCTLFAGSRGMDGPSYENALKELDALDALKAQGWKVVDSPFDAR